MKSAVLAKPNLKVIIAGALFLLAIGQWVDRGYSKGQVFVHVRGTASPAYLQSLLSQAEKYPSPELYLQISAAYESRGNYKTALKYLRKADVYFSSDPDN